jgi:hypothetical protein
MTRKQNSNEWSGGIADHPARKIPSTKIRWKNFRLDFFGIKTATFHIIYFPKGQSINTKYYPSMLVQFKDF